MIWLGNVMMATGRLARRLAVERTKPVPRGVKAARDTEGRIAVGCFMCSELTPAWLLEIGAAFVVTFDPIFGEQGSTVEKPLPPCIVSFVSMPQIRDLKRSWFNAMPLPALG